MFCLFRFVPTEEDIVKFTVDLSEDGPVFSALDQMMLRMLDQVSQFKTYISYCVKHKTKIIMSCTAVAFVFLIKQCCL